MSDTLQEDYQNFIHQSRYARWLPSENRRETWSETVRRYVDFFSDGLSSEEKEELYTAIYNKDVMPSMRAMMTAGIALEKDNVAGYNCAYMPIEHPKCFDEMMYILMCGTGVGFSVERQYVNNLPMIPNIFILDPCAAIQVKDSKIGWCYAFRLLISALYRGEIPTWDLSKIRPKGAILKTFGGRASGPEPLDELFKFTVKLFTEAAGRKLTSIECHDLACKIASIVVVGGVRRSALISLSNLSDDRMAHAKMGRWYDEDQQPYRALANNSVAYTEKPELKAFLKEWSNLYESKAGERGIFSRVGARHVVWENNRRDPSHEWGTNPCSEIILRPYQFCNLSEVVVRPEDRLEDLQRKVRLATILGTLQSRLTDFRYLRPIWRRNCEEERLLGVSLTGIMDNILLNGQAVVDNDGGWALELEDTLIELKATAIETNRVWAERLGINQSTAITCVKPSGTVSQLCNTASGIHPRYALRYIRRVRMDTKDPLTAFLIDQGVPRVTDSDSKDHEIFEFPVESPYYSVMRDDRTAIEQLQVWLAYARYWCEHKPSVTIYVKEDEWLDVAAFVWKHFDEMSGVSFLPHTDFIYKNAPYEEIDADKYTKLAEAFPRIDWSKFHGYEQEDNTVSSQELACTGGACEL